MKELTGIEKAQAYVAAKQAEREAQKREEEARRAARKQSIRDQKIALGLAVD